jgi:hypothetical protein
MHFNNPTEAMDYARRALARGSGVQLDKESETALEQMLSRGFATATAERPGRAATNLVVDLISQMREEFGKYIVLEESERRSRPDEPPRRIDYVRIGIFQSVVRVICPMCPFC